MLKSAGRKQKAEGTSAGIAVVLLVVAAAAAAAATLSGVVLDADTRQPVSYAAVSAPNLDLNVTADSTGAFALEVEPGLKRVTVTVTRLSPGSTSSAKAPAESAVVLSSRFGALIAA